MFPMRRFCLRLFSSYLPRSSWRRPRARARSGCATGRTRIRDRARERECRDDVRSQLARAVPRGGAAVEGRIHPQLLRRHAPELGKLYVAMVSGPGFEPPDAGRLAFSTRTSSGATGPDGQALGDGCVYPASVNTVAGQLTAKWPDLEGLHGGHGERHHPRGCAVRPARPQHEGQDADRRAERPVRGPAQTRSSTSTRSSTTPCRAKQHGRPARPVAGGPGRGRARRRITPSFTPNLCHDGHDTPCANGEPGGLVSADTWLRQWVPRIMRSPAFTRTDCCS